MSAISSAVNSGITRVPPTKLKPRSTGTSKLTGDPMASVASTGNPTSNASEAQNTGKRAPVASCRRRAQARRPITAKTAITNAAATIPLPSPKMARGMITPRLFRKTAGGPIHSARPRHHRAMTSGAPK